MLVEGHCPSIPNYVTIFLNLSIKSAQCKEEKHLKRKVALLIIMLWITLCLLAACGDDATDSHAAEHKGQEKLIEKKEAPSQSSTENEPNEGEDNKEQTEHAKKESDNTQAEQQVQGNNMEKEQENAPSQNTEHPEKKESPADQTKIMSGEAAVSYLKKELDMETEEGILFDDMGGSLHTDESGAYYRVELISKSMQKNGGSGTVGLYKVYQNGNYESQF